MALSLLYSDFFKVIFCNLFVCPSTSFSILVQICIVSSVFLHDCYYKITILYSLTQRKITNLFFERTKNNFTMLFFVNLISFYNLPSHTWLSTRISVFLQYEFCFSVSQFPTSCVVQKIFLLALYFFITFFY